MKIKRLARRSSAYSFRTDTAGESAEELTLFFLKFAPLAQLKKVFHLHLEQDMLLAHRIRLDPTAAQRGYFMRAAGTTRRVWNWALAEWLRQRDAGGKPNAMALKKQFNAIKYCHPDWLDQDGNPWLRTMHRDSHSQPFAHLAQAWSRYFGQIKAGVQAYPPRFKKKGRCPESFYVANDKFRLDDACIVLPKLGRVKLREALRFEGKIMGATVLREVDHWYVSVQVDVPQQQANCQRTGDGICGVDLGISAAATLDSGEQIVSPRPLKAALRRLRIRSRRANRKLAASRKAAGIPGAIHEGAHLPISNNRMKDNRRLASLHARIAAVRCDFTNKLTTRLCRENQTVVVEDLCVKGMLRNATLARSISDIGFGRIRAQLAYKSERYGTVVIVADRWFPSSKLCSACGFKHTGLVLSERYWTCEACGARHQRDHNAAINLRRLATGQTGDASKLRYPRPAGDGKGWH